MEAAIGQATDVAAHILAIVERNNRAFRRASREALDLPAEQQGRGHRGPTWWLASELRGLPGMRSLPNWEAVTILDEVLVPHGGWSLLPATDVWETPTDPRDDLLRVWDLIRTPLKPAIEPKAALPLADRWPLSSRRWPTDADAAYRRAVGVTYWYARILAADGRFFISHRKFGELLETSHVTAGGYLHRMMGEGLLEMIEPGRPRRAARFRFDLAAVSQHPQDRTNVDRQVDRHCAAGARR